MNCTSYALVNFKPVTGDQSASSCEALIIEDNRIASLCTRTDLHPELPVIDLKGLNLSPGFIDLQVNGCGGVLFNNAITAETLDIMHATNLKFGCTSFLPTLISSSDEDIRQAISVVREYQKQHPDRVPGLHLEGPYLNVEKKGIHNPDFIRQPSEEMIDYLCEQADVITMITLAPEKCPAGSIEKLTAAGIIVSVGHSNATYQQVKAAEEAGARFVTHLHNAMSPLGSREPGVVGATFDSQTLAAGIIADGLHLSWENLRIAHRLLGDRLVLVTDASTPAGTDMETFEFAGQTIFHKDGRCSNADGTLAGSALTMMAAVQNSIQHGISQDAVIRMATINAARAIHKEHEIGRIKEGQFANLAIFDDQYQLHGTISGGHLNLAEHSAVKNVLH